jgi:hypothetical protein
MVAQKIYWLFELTLTPPPFRSGLWHYASPSIQDQIKILYNHKLIEPIVASNPPLDTTDHSYPPSEIDSTPYHKLLWLHDTLILAPKPSTSTLTIDHTIQQRLDSFYQGNILLLYNQLTWLSPASLRLNKPLPPPTNINQLKLQQMLTTITQPAHNISSPPILLLCLPPTTLPN